jgi:hypothetical protein
MTHLRKENAEVAVVTRKVCPELWVTTLDGTLARATSWCSCCKKELPKNHFYLKAYDDQNHPNDVRDKCIPCFDAQSEKSREKRNFLKVQKELGNMLQNFDIEEVV